MAKEKQRAHVAADVKPIPANLTFCRAHTTGSVPDFWKSGTILARTSSTQQSTCNPGAKTFVLYMTASEISSGLKKDDRIVIEFDNAQSGDVKFITSYRIDKPFFSFSLDLPAFAISASAGLVDEPAPEARGILSRLLSRIHFESRIVLFDSFSWRSSASHVSLEEPALAADLVRAVDEEREPPRESGFPSYPAHEDRDALGRKTAS